VYTFSKYLGVISKLVAQDFMHLWFIIAHLFRVWFFYWSIVCKVWYCPEGSVYSKNPKILCLLRSCKRWFKIRRKWRSFSIVCTFVNAKERSGTVIYGTRIVQCKFFLIDLLFRPSLLAVLNGTGVSLFSFPRHLPHLTALTPFCIPARLWELYEGFLPFYGGKGSDCDRIFVCVVIRELADR
jgi:hypothetical protein